MTETRLFGTDGIRGVANVDLTPELAMGIARAAGDGRSGTVVLGRDTRRSGQMLSAAVASGFHAAGLDTIDAGIVPVAAVSHLVTSTGSTYGVMVSASHNPAPDNGIKFFGPDGSKLADEQELAIERRYRHGEPWAERVGDAVGMGIARRGADIEHADRVGSLAAHRLEGIAVALDCTHGSAFRAAPALFESLGADVLALNTEPTGMNINEGSGAVHPEFLAARADGRVGLAFDGDADRLIAVDEDGVVCNGDVIMAVLARYLHEREQLVDDRVVVTVMSNLGFRVAMQGLGISVSETKVGDRYVLEEMRAIGASLGGEQSGHVVFGDEPTGDGLLTGMRLLEVMAATGAPLRELRRLMVEYPQVLRNVRVRVKERLDDATAVWDAVARLERRLGDDGRILVRPSGTEPLVRVMVEARTAPDAAGIAEELATIVRRELGEVVGATDSTM